MRVLPRSLGHHDMEVEVVRVLVLDGLSLRVEGVDALLDHAHFFTLLLEQWHVIYRGALTAVEVLGVLLLLPELGCIGIATQQALVDLLQY